MNDKLIKGIGIGTTVIGIAAVQVSNWVNNKKQDALIEEKINEALVKKESEES